MAKLLCPSVCMRVSGVCVLCVLCVCVAFIGHMQHALVWVSFFSILFSFLLVVVCCWGVKLDKRLFGQQMKLSLSLGGRGFITPCLCACVCVCGVLLLDDGDYGQHCTVGTVTGMRL